MRWNSSNCETATIWKNSLAGAGKGAMCGGPALGKADGRWWTGIWERRMGDFEIVFEAERQSLEAGNLMEAVYIGLSGMETAFMHIQKWGNRD